LLGEIDRESAGQAVGDNTTEEVTRANIEVTRDGNVTRVTGLAKKKKKTERSKKESHTQ